VDSDVMISILKSQCMEKIKMLVHQKGGNMDVLDAQWAIAWILGKAESLE